MAFIEGDCIASHEAAHDLAEWNCSSAQEEVKVIGHQGPCVALGLGFFQDDGKPTEERFAVFVVPEDFATFNSSGHDVLEKAGGV
ncbi:MAG: hypothetical protein R6T98_15805 [Desulfatiglandales bacterium]